MIDAKNKFREGFIMLNRPFDFDELKNPLQKMTILWAYTEQPIFEKELSNAAKERIEELNNVPGMFKTTNPWDSESYVDKHIKSVYESEASYDNLYKGDIVQTYVDGQLCRFNPDEYTIMSQEKMAEILQEEGYHAICHPILLKEKSFIERKDYIKSRGLDDRTAAKWAGITFKDAVIYKPYFQLLEMFCRDYEIYEDKFYSEVEGIDYEVQRDSRDSKSAILVKF
jgi:hypothetical protein